MTVLMTAAGPAAADALLTRIGGVPLAPAGTAWPYCATCAGPMQFLAQIVLDGADRRTDRGAEAGHGVLLLFMCQNDPGMCDEWSPTAGGNRAMLLPAGGLLPLPLPLPLSGSDEDEDEDEDDTVLLGSVDVAALEPATTADYGRACTEWAERTGRSRLELLGQLGGTPSWLQYDETPDCPSCARPMALVVQLEEGPDHRTAMNFGGRGHAYAFACEPCGHAAFLWQC